MRKFKYLSVFGADTKCYMKLASEGLVAHLASDKKERCLVAVKLERTRRKDHDPSEAFERSIS